MGRQFTTKKPGRDRAQSEVFIENRAKILDFMLSCGPGAKIKIIDMRNGLEEDKENTKIELSRQRIRKHMIELIEEGTVRSNRKGIYELAVSEYIRAKPIDRLKDILEEKTTRMSFDTILEKNANEGFHKKLGDVTLIFTIPSIISDSQEHKIRKTIMDAVRNNKNVARIHKSFFIGYIVNTDTRPKKTDFADLVGYIPGKKDIGQ